MTSDPRHPTPEATTEDTRPDFLITLGVLLPCSPEDVKQAYLDKVKTAHPDKGGDPAAFRALQTAFERATEYARFHSGRSRWLANSVERYVAQQEIIFDIQNRGGRCEVETLDWLKREIGEDFAQVMEQISGVRFAGEKFGDAEIDYLINHQKQLATVRWIDFSRSKITNAGLLRLAAFDHLEKLELRGARVGRAVVTLARQLPKLEWLGIAGTKVGWLGRWQLRRMRRIDVAL